MEGLEWEALGKPSHASRELGRQAFGQGYSLNVYGSATREAARARGRPSSSG